MQGNQNQNLNFLFCIICQSEPTINMEIKQIYDSQNIHKKEKLGELHFIISHLNYKASVF